MRVKALLLGAGPLPVEGPWVNMEGEGRWSCRVEENPTGTTNGTLALEVRKPSGEVTVLSPSDELEGEEVRAVLREAIQGTLCVFLEANGA